MSDQAAGQPGGEQGSLDAGVSHSTEVSSELTSVSRVQGRCCRGCAGVRAVHARTLDVGTYAVGTCCSEAAVSEDAQSRGCQAEAGAPASRPEAANETVLQIPGRVIVMPRGERAWTGPEIHVEPEAVEAAGQRFGKRRIAAIAAVLALATFAGAVGGALATASLMHGSGDMASNTSASSSPLEASLSRIDGDIQALKTGLDHTSKLGISQFNKTTERLDKLERSQVEPGQTRQALRGDRQAARFAGPAADCGGRRHVSGREGNHRFDRAGSTGAAASAGSRTDASRMRRPT